jgi:hypothetical protein
VLGLGIFVAAAGGCSPGGAVDHELVCSVARSHAYSRVPEGEAAWEWPASAKQEIAKPGWREAGDELVRGCGRGRGTLPRVERVAISADRKLALVTRNSFPDEETPQADPMIEMGVELSGSIETCLLRRERVLKSEEWQPVACKLDAVS